MARLEAGARKRTSPPMAARTSPALLVKFDLAVALFAIAGAALLALLR